MILCSVGRLWFPAAFAVLALGCELLAFHSCAKWNSSVRVAEEEEAGGTHTSYVEASGDQVISSLAGGCYPVSGTQVVLLITSRIQFLSLFLSLPNAVLFGNVSWIEYQYICHYFCLSLPHGCDSCHPNSWWFCNSIQYSLHHTAPVGFQRPSPLPT